MNKTDFCCVLWSKIDEINLFHDFDLKYFYMTLISYNACKVLTCTILCGLMELL